MSAKQSPMIWNKDHRTHYKVVMFYWKLRVMFVIYPLYIPPSFIRQPSGQWTGHKGMWLDGVKRMGEGWVSVFGERSGVTDIWQHMSRPGSHAHTHRLRLLNNRVCNLLSAICPHLHIRQRAKWPNAGFDAKQTQRFTGIIPSSDPASAFVRRLQKWLVIFHFLHSQPLKIFLIFNNSKSHLNLSCKLHFKTIPQKTHATSAIIFSGVICTNHHVQ